MVGIQLKMDNSRSIKLSELWMHRLVCRTKFNGFLPDNPCREVGLAESQYGWRTPQEYSGCDLLVQRTSAVMVHSIWKKEIPRTSRTITKVTKFLKELANTINTK